MIAEVYDGDVREVMKYYGDSNESLADFPFNFYMITELPTRAHLSGHSLKETINLWMDNMPDGKWSNWVVSCYS